MVRHAGLILMKRGAVDRRDCNLAHLQGGGRLGIPEGWEKPIDHVKSGAAYLSQAAARASCQWPSAAPTRSGGVCSCCASRVTVTIGRRATRPRLRDRQQRQADLEAASVSLMRQIYMMLPPTTQAHYDRQARLEFRGEMLFRPNSLALPAGISLDALAELVAKPNLFSPLHRNARLPVRPFVRQGCFVRPRAMKRAADAWPVPSTSDFSVIWNTAWAAKAAGFGRPGGHQCGDGRRQTRPSAFRPQARARPHQDAAFL